MKFMKKGLCHKKIMKIVCIAGYCGVGKTTISKLISNELPNSIIIKGDTFWIDAILSKKEKFKEIYGLQLDEKKPYEMLINLSNNKKLDSIKKFSDFFEEFVPFIENGIENEIQKYIQEKKTLLL